MNREDNTRARVTHQLSRESEWVLLNLSDLRQTAVSELTWLQVAGAAKALWLELSSRVCCWVRRVLGVHTIISVATLIPHLVVVKKYRIKTDVKSQQRVMDWLLYLAHCVCC